MLLLRFFYFCHLRLHFQHCCLLSEMIFCSIFGCYLLHRTMKNVLTISILTCVLTFCGRNQAVDESLDRAESCMSASPDSALAILESIDSLHFDSRSQNARYALLKSIALDKNYIDRTDDSLINIAVSYYRHRLNAPYKFKSYYYQARIYQNAGQMDKAMESLVCAEHIRSGKFQPRIERDCISLNHRYSQIDMIILIIWFQNLNWLSLIPWKLGRLIIMCHHCWIKREHI